MRYIMDSSLDIFLKRQRRRIVKAMKRILPRCTYSLEVVGDRDGISVSIVHPEHKNPLYFPYTYTDFEARLKKCAQFKSLLEEFEGTGDTSDLDYIWAVGAFERGFYNEADTYIKRALNKRGIL
jgi:hypothetical protein